MALPLAGAAIQKTEAEPLPRDATTPVGLPGTFAFGMEASTCVWSTEERSTREEAANPWDSPVGAQ